MDSSPSAHAWWSRLRHQGLLLSPVVMMAMCRLIYGGSAHGAFPLRAYGGVLFRPGDQSSPDPVVRALHILEHCIPVGDATIYHVLRKLLRGPLPVIRGRSKALVEGPVDYTDLRTEFIGLIYEGLLDYRVKRTDEQIGPQVFLNLGREPVLPLSRLQDMLAGDRKGLKDLLTTLRKEKVTASAAEEEEEPEEEAEDANQGEAEAAEEPAVEAEAAADEVQHTGNYLDAVESARRWAREAVVLAGLVRKQGKKESDSQYQQEVEAEANRLIKRVVATGEFYLVRAGNTRKGTGTFYTRPQLAVPTVHRTLEPLCFVRDETEETTKVTKDTKAEPAVVPAEYAIAAEAPGEYASGTSARAATPSPRYSGERAGVRGDAPFPPLPRTPEEILSLKVCDPACGSASFLVAALHYLTDALYKSLCHHCHLDDPSTAKKITLPYGRPRMGKDGEELVPFPPDDPQRGHTFQDRIKALLRRHVVERCIYGVDINPLAVELARVSLWVETLDPELPFSFLDHKIKVGNSLVGCWLDRVDEYPILAWEREGGDGPDGVRTDRIETFLKGPKEAKTTKKGKLKLQRSGDGRIKKEMRQVIASRFSQQPELFPKEHSTTGQVVAQAREYERLHELPAADPDEREQYYRSHIEGSQTLRTLKAAMNEWCAIWFWPTDADSLCHVPTPLTFHKPSPERTAIVSRLAMDLKFFHWEMEFPDVFTPDRSGFDAMIGNPPWDVMKPNSQEFFTDFDPLYRTYDKQAALRKQTELFQAVLYGLSTDDFDWIVRVDPSDTKGFYRVDRQLPFRERLTGLAAAFRALKDGKWSAESAASLSNDQFFEILGIPELTNAKAAASKGLPGPLILKRDGCHVWQPETFPADDPRHGWTWDHCWQDAVALLGSEDAVRRYIAGESESPAPAAADEGQFTLQNKPPKPKQGRLF